MSWHKVSSSRLVHLLPWQDLVSLASASRSFRNDVREALRDARVDLSGGLDPQPVACAGRDACDPSSEAAQGGLGGPLPAPFSYAVRNAYPFGLVREEDADTLQGCTCSGSCPALLGPEDGSDPSDRMVCACALLNIAAGSEHVARFECHSGCGCGPGCPLRATQPLEAAPFPGGGRAGKHRDWCSRTAPSFRAVPGRGGATGSPVPPRLLVKHTGAKGWGVIALDGVAAGAFVAEYTGEVLPVEVAREHAAKYDDQGGANYLITVLERFPATGQVWRTAVDATRLGSAARFFNHSCDPCLDMHVVRRGSLLPHLVLVARRAIPAGSELTFDYGGSQGGAAGGGPAAGTGARAETQPATPPGTAAFEACGTGVPQQVQRQSPPWLSGSGPEGTSPSTMAMTATTMVRRSGWAAEGPPPPAERCREVGPSVSAPTPLGGAAADPGPDALARWAQGAVSQAGAVGEPGSGPSGPRPPAMGPGCDRAQGRGQGRRGPGQRPPGRAKCRCGAAACRGVLPFDPQAFDCGLDGGLG